MRKFFVAGSFLLTYFRHYSNLKGAWIGGWVKFLLLKGEAYWKGGLLERGCLIIVLIIIIIIKGVYIVANNPHGSKAQ